MIIVTDLELKLLNTLLHANDVLLNSSLVVFEDSDLLLETGALGLLVSVVPLDLLFNTMQLVGESLACILLLHCENALQGLFLRAKDLALLLVGVQLLLQLSHCVVQVVQLALQVSRVVAALTTRQSSSARA